MSNRNHHRVRGPRGLVVTLMGFTALAAAGCDDTTPTNPTASGDIVAAQSVQDVWSLLPSTEQLEVEALGILAIDGADGLAAALLFDAGDLASEADAADQDGDDTDQSRLEEAADTLATEGFFAAFDAAAAEAMIDDVEAAMASLDRELATNSDSEVRERLREAADALGDARAARARRDHARALRRAIRASDALRWLDPEAKAKAAVVAASALLERAEELAGDDAEAPITRALNVAGTFCTSARVALGAEQWRRAIADARVCARISRAVIVRLSVGIDPDVLAERAMEAVAHAGAVLERVSEQAGDSPAPRVATLLEQADGLLGRARVALDEERYRAAIGLAASSTAHSLRALRLIRDDIPDPLELRATVAMEVGLALSARAQEQIGPDTAPEIVEAAGRADGLLAEAQTAFENGEWRETVRLARHAIVIYVRILVALA